MTNMDELRNEPVPQRMSEMQNQDNDESDELGDMALIQAAAKSMRTINVDDGPAPRGKRRVSSVRASTATTTIPEGEETNDSEVPESTVPEPKGNATELSRDRRFSLTQLKVRSMSALLMRTRLDGHYGLF